MCLPKKRTQPGWYTYALCSSNPYRISNHSQYGITHPEQKKRISYHVSNHMLALSTYVHDVDLNLNISLGVGAVLFGN